jgi:thiamine biosynthesis lipoprotein
MALVGYEDLTLDRDRMTVGLKRTGQSIDLGGIGKGFAADKIVELFRGYGISSAFTNFGGNVAAIGSKPDGSPWHVGIRHPRKEEGLIGAVLVSDKSVVTSGDYQRYFVDNDGIRYHHILDPATGYPADSGLVSVTVISDSSVTADALSTLLFVAGMEKGIECLESFPGTEAIFADRKLNIYVTERAMEYFQAAEEVNAICLKRRKGSGK